jgi:hypothetical protein
MSDTITGSVKNAAGEAVSIEIPIPNADTAAGWNEAMQSGAQKAGVEIPGVTSTAAAATTDTTKKDEPADKLFRATLTVNGTDMVFEDADPAKVLGQYTAAVQAAQLAPAPAAAKVDEKKPEVAAVDMFDIGTKLIAGDASGLKDYLKKSNILGEMLAEEGISIAQIKAVTQKTLSDEAHDEWTTATNGLVAKVKAGESDFPGGEQNMKMMGIMLGRLTAEAKAEGKQLPRTVATMESAYALMKKEGLVFPVEKKTTTAAVTTTTTTKTAPSSTAIGASGGGKETPQAAAIDPNRKFEIDMTVLSPEEAARAHRELLQQGVKPEQIVVKQ